MKDSPEYKGQMFWVRTKFKNSKYILFNPWCVKEMVTFIGFIVFFSDLLWSRNHHPHPLHHLRPRRIRPDPETFPFLQRPVRLGHPPLLHHRHRQLHLRGVRHACLTLLHLRDKECGRLRPVCLAGDPSDDAR